MIHRFILAITSTMVAVGLPSRMDAQAIAAPDSQKILQATRAAQVRFERVRRQHMQWGSPNYGTCEIRIGRYCLTNIDWGDEESWTEPEEDPKVELARYTLITRLDSAAHLIPGDGWVAGQRVPHAPILTSEVVL